MTEIPFTQFLRPSGERRQTFIDMPREVALLAKRFLEEGGRYTSEMIRPGEVNLCAEFTIDDERRDIVSLIAQNGPDIVDAVEKLIRESYKFLQEHEAST
jgi:hypothetical protein